MEIVVPDEFKYLYARNEERPVVKIPDPVLRKKAIEVKSVGKRSEELIQTMIAAMKLARGIGLAAPQMGVSERVIVISPDGKMLPIINPVIVTAEGSCVREEGCLSIPGLYGDVVRPEFVIVEGYDRKGRPARWEMEGLAARVVQHEVDHLEGVLFIDKVDISTLHWSNPEGDDEFE